MFQTEGPRIKTPIVYGRDESRFQKTPGIQHQGIERCLWAYPRERVGQRRTMLGNCLAEVRSLVPYVTYGPCRRDYIDRVNKFLHLDLQGI